VLIYVVRVVFWAYCSRGMFQFFSAGVGKYAKAILYCNR
jgi:hypothetical protein